MKYICGQTEETERSLLANKYLIFLLNMMFTAPTFAPGGLTLDAGFPGKVSHKHGQCYHVSMTFLSQSFWMLMFCLRICLPVQWAIHSSTEFFFCERFWLSEKITLTCFTGMFSEANCNFLPLAVYQNLSFFIPNNKIFFSHYCCETLPVYGRRSRPMPVF